MLIIPDVLKRFFEQIEKEEISQFIISPVKVADIKLLPFPGNINKKKVLNAINPDKDARIFEYSDYGILTNFEDILEANL